MFPLLLIAATRPAPATSEDGARVRDCLRGAGAGCRAQEAAKVETHGTPHLFRSGGLDGNALENRSGLTATAGSNPTPSAVLLSDAAA